MQKGGEEFMEILTINCTFLYKFKLHLVHAFFTDFTRILTCFYYPYGMWFNNTRVFFWKRNLLTRRLAVCVSIKMVPNFLTEIDCQAIVLYRRVSGICNRAYTHFTCFGIFLHSGL